MTYITTAFLVATLVFVLLTVRDTRRNEHDRREYARERQLLLAQLLHATGNTWTPPPAAEPEPPAAPAELQPVRWTSAPERFPA